MPPSSASALPSLATLAVKDLIAILKNKVASDEYARKALQQRLNDIETDRIAEIRAKLNVVQEWPAGITVDDAARAIAAHDPSVDEIRLREILALPTPKPSLLTVREIVALYEWKIIPEEFARAIAQQHLDRVRTIRIADVRAKLAALPGWPTNKSIDVASREFVERESTADERRLAEILEPPPPPAMPTAVAPPAPPPFLTTPEGRRISEAKHELRRALADLRIAVDDYNDGPVRTGPLSIVSTAITATLRRFDRIPGGTNVPVEETVHVSRARQGIVAVYGAGSDKNTLLPARGRHGSEPPVVVLALESAVMQRTSAPRDETSAAAPAEQDPVDRERRLLREFCYGATFIASAKTNDAATAAFIQRWADEEGLTYASDQVMQILSSDNGLTAALGLNRSVLFLLRWLQESTARERRELAIRRRILECERAAHLAGEPPKAADRLRPLSAVLGSELRLWLDSRVALARRATDKYKQSAHDWVHKNASKLLENVRLARNNPNRAYDLWAPATESRQALAKEARDRMATVFAECARDEGITATDPGKFWHRLAEYIFRDTLHVDTGDAAGLDQEAETRKRLLELVSESRARDLLSPLTLGHEVPAEPVEIPPDPHSYGKARLLWLLVREGSSMPMRFLTPIFAIFTPLALIGIVIKPKAFFEWIGLSAKESVETTTTGGTNIETAGVGNVWLGITLLVFGVVAGCVIVYHSMRKRREEQLELARKNAAKQLIDSHDKQVETVFKEWEKVLRANAAVWLNDVVRWCETELEQRYEREVTEFDRTTAEHTRARALTERRAEHLKAIDKARARAQDAAEAITEEAAALAD